MTTGEARKGTNTQQEDNGHDERSEKGQEVSKTGPRLHGEPEMGQLVSNVCESERASN